MTEDYAARQNENVLKIKALREEHPFKNTQIEKFYTNNFGDTPNSFIQSKPMHRDFHDAIFTLLDFYDTHGDKTIYLTCKGTIAFKPSEIGVWHKTTLLHHVLKITQRAIDFNKFNDYEARINWHGNYRLIYAGISALAGQTCYGFGEDYIQKFNNETHQASLAILDNMPTVKNLHCRGSIIDIMKICYIYSWPNRIYDNIHQYKASENITGIAKTVLEANLHTIRETIYKSARPVDIPVHFGLGANQEQQAKDIIDQAVSERDSFLSEHKIEDVLSKNHAYLKENDGLRKKNTSLETEKKLLNQIIKALKKDDQQALITAQNELKALKKNQALHNS